VSYEPPPSDPPIPDAEEILKAIRQRMAMLRPLVVEHDRLAQAEASLDKALRKL
jgi:hypothetical protein